MKILTVGDGNFSYSLALCRKMCLDGFADKSRNMGEESETGETVEAPKSKRRRKVKLREIRVELTATSVDSRDEIFLKYRESRQIITELERLGAQVRHGVDACDIAASADLPSRLFDRIVFNHPHTGVESADLHKSLLAHFLGSATRHLALGGEIHLALCNTQAADWEVLAQAAKHALRLKSRAPFPWTILAAHGFEHKRHQINRSFPNQDSEIIIFECLADGPTASSSSSSPVGDAKCSMCWIPLASEEERATHVESLRPPPMAVFRCNVCHRLFTDVRAFEQHKDMMAQRDADVHYQHNLCRCKHPPSLIVPESAILTSESPIDDAIVPEDHLPDSSSISASHLPCTLCSGCFLCTPQCRKRNCS